MAERHDSQSEKHSCMDPLQEPQPKSKGTHFRWSFSWSNWKDAMPSLKCSGWRHSRRPSGTSRCWRWPTNGRGRRWLLSTYEPLVPKKLVGGRWKKKYGASSGQGTPMHLVLVEASRDAENKNWKPSAEEMILSSWAEAQHPQVSQLFGWYHLVFQKPTEFLKSRRITTKSSWSLGMAHFL